MRKIIFAFFLLAVMFYSAKAQQVSVEDEKVLPKDCGVSYKKWHKTDVAYIITQDETNAFLKLKTNEEREQFIESFWRRRDPNSDTEINEFRERYYERFTFANENFASGVPGWKTDRGRIYIIFGKPDKIEKGKAKFEDLENILFEKWFYKQLEETGKSFAVMFIDPTESKEFRFLKEKRSEILEILSPQGLRVLYN